ncbi:MAG: hypothetical protein JSV16_07330, partial [Candidatus Hydrogenedentota bacterium]
LVARANDDVQSYLSFVEVFSREEKDKLLSPALKRYLNDSGEQEWKVRLKRNMDRKGWHFFNRLIRQEFDSWLPDNILFKQDRLTMGNSIEGRVPFLDHRIVEFCARLPIRLKTRGTNKYLIRKTADRRIYESSDSTKRPFFMPLTGAFERPYQDLINEYLSDTRVRSDGWWNSDFVKEIVANRQRSSLLYDKQIMVLILWRMWTEVFSIEAPT